VIEAAESKDLNLLIFLGGPAWGQRRGKVIYELAGPETVDGIIAVAGCIDMSREGMAQAAMATTRRRLFSAAMHPFPW
jgi:hypothetical protein